MNEAEQLLQMSWPSLRTEHSVAQKIQTFYVDDLDGSEAEGTVRFALDGTSYEIDLSTAHAKALRKTLEKYTGAGRKVSSRGRSRRTASAGSDSSAVREWAKSQGIQVSDRGRVAAELVVKFQAATGA